MNEKLKFICDKITITFLLLIAILLFVIAYVETQPHLSCVKTFFLYTPIPLLIIGLLLHIHIKTTLWEHENKPKV